MPPMDTSVSHPWAKASGIRYSNLRVLLPPKASPLLQSSRLANRSTLPPRCALRRFNGWIVVGPNVNGWRGKRFRFMAATLVAEDLTNVHVISESGGNAKPEGSRL